jgi:hypothetical protein
VEDLDRNPPANRLLYRFEDSAHAALAKFPHDAIWTYPFGGHT